MLGRLAGFSDRGLLDHFSLMDSYLATLEEMKRQYPLKDWTQPVGGQAPAPAGVAEFMGTRIADLDLTPGGLLMDVVQVLDQELSAAGIQWRPKYVLGDGEFWTADRATTINVPWFLANPTLWWLVNERTTRYSPEEVARALRHEVGHAIGYAFEAWKRPEWIALFGDFNATYRDGYTADPTSLAFVRYLHRTGDRHYAQKHPDEDWAETFAVWLDSRSDWRRTYPEGTDARTKLDFVDRLVLSGALSAPVAPNAAPGDVNPAKVVVPGTVADFLGKTSPSPAWSDHSEMLRREPYVWNAAALHGYYFEGLGGGGAEPSLALQDAVRAAFGAWESWLLDLRAVAGSVANGWALAVWDSVDNRIRNVLVEDHRTGPLVGCPVLLAIDCWEHAYIGDYGLRRDLYLGAFFRNIDWEVVNGRFASLAGRPIIVTGLPGVGPEVPSLDDMDKKFGGGGPGMVLVEREREGKPWHYWVKEGDVQAGDKRVAESRVVNSPKEAASAIAAEIARTHAGRPDFPGLDKITKNWEKKLTPEHFKASAEQVAAVEAAVTEVESDPRFTTLTEKFGVAPTMLLTKTISSGAEPPVGSAAEHVASATVLYPYAFKAARGDEELKAGVSGTPGAGGLPAVIRHEYGHKIWGQISSEQRVGFIERLPRDVAGGLTRYAGKNDEEAHSELLATYLDPAFRPEAFPEMGPALDYAKVLWGLE